MIDIIFVCPRCGMVSHNPEDYRTGYCGACHDFTAPAPPFEGYRRAPEIEAAVLMAVAAALRAHPTERLGQILVNAVEDVRELLYEVHDEVVAERLLDYAEEATP